jgi:hypothetical protein
MSVYLLLSSLRLRSSALTDEMNEIIRRSVGLGTRLKHYCKMSEYLLLRPADRSGPIIAYNGSVAAISCVVKSEQFAPGTLVHIGKFARRPLMGDHNAKI